MHTHQDICDACLWLCQTFRMKFVNLWIERHFTDLNHKIEEITAIWPRNQSTLTTSAAQEGFIALGYNIENTGAGVIIPDTTP